MATDYVARTEELYKAMAETTDPDIRIEIRNRVVELNIRLVSVVLKKYQPYTADNFQNGCLGLIQAAETYRIATGVPFASYACLCIERAIQMAYKKSQRTIEESVQSNKWVYLDADRSLGESGDTFSNSELVWDERAEASMEDFIRLNELEYMANNIIKPAIQEIADRGKHMPTKVDIELWKKLEFVYILDMVFIESQKQRFNLSQLARSCGLSVQNVRMRHERVMDSLFQRMWEYMTLSFSEMLQRLRGEHTIPGRLLCLDPGKTTGWCLFENGHLTKAGHIEDCYDDENVNAIALLTLLQEVEPDYIVYEDYKIYANKLSQHSFNPVFTIRLIGVVEAFAQMNDIPVHKQMASTAKGFVTDDKLKQWAMWETGKKHARDAMRHGCYFLLFHKRGQDIV